MNSLLALFSFSLRVFLWALRLWSCLERAFARLRRLRSSFFEGGFAILGLGEGFVSSG